MTKQTFKEYRTKIKIKKKKAFKFQINVQTRNERGNIRISLGKEKPPGRHVKAKRSNQYFFS
jgi:hypothetical protein